MEEFKSLRKEYRLEKARWGSLGKERAKTPEPEEPKPKMFLIAGDNSGTGVLENLIEADGVGLIWRDRGGYRQHRHRHGLRPLERYLAQMLRS